MFQTMSKIGFFKSITDPAGFLQILCTSVSHMTTLQHQPAAESPEAIALSTQAIQSVNSRLGDPVLHTSDGMVAAILTFCCHTVSGPNRCGQLKHKTVSNGSEDHVQRRSRLEDAHQRVRCDNSAKRGHRYAEFEPTDEDGFILVGD